MSQDHAPGVSKFLSPLRDFTFCSAVYTSCMLEADCGVVSQRLQACSPQSPSLIPFVCAATSGGAGYCAGDITPLSGSLVIAQSTFTANDAQLGGSLYATTGCVASIRGSQFVDNTARQYGSAIVTTDSVTLGVESTTFLGNGAANGIAPPSAGGAISIGYNQFVVGMVPQIPQVPLQHPNRTNFLLPKHKPLDVSHREVHCAGSSLHQKV